MTTTAPSTFPFRNGSCRAIFVVEVMEPFLSPWLFLELLHISEIVGRSNLWITRVRRKCEREVLTPVANLLSEKSIVELEDKIPSDAKVIVLDPAAESQLSAEDFTGLTFVIIGGIMGSHPPSGRTRKELTLRMKRALARGLGPHQLTVNGAAYVARKVCEGLSLSEIPLVKGLSLHTRYGTTELPYAFPQDDEGGLVIARGEVDYVLTELEEDEAAMLRGRVRDFCSKLRRSLHHLLTRYGGSIRDVHISLNHL